MTYLSKNQGHNIFVAAAMCTALFTLGCQNNGSGAPQASDQTPREASFLATATSTKPLPPESYKKVGTMLSEALSNKKLPKADDIANNIGNSDLDSDGRANLQRIKQNCQINSGGQSGQPVTQTDPANPNSSTTTETISGEHCPISFNQVSKVSIVGNPAKANSMNTSTTSTSTLKVNDTALQNASGVLQIEVSSNATVNGLSSDLMGGANPANFSEGQVDITQTTTYVDGTKSIIVINADTKTSPGNDVSAMLVTANTPAGKLAVARFTRNGQSVMIINGRREASEEQMAKDYPGLFPN